ncbi:tetratricopeptide repeat protein [Pelotalea chapellei]|uniref:Tetratricopeptide repeat protein n=1 Tax=Pelotalea chapellei TaxID=44671 RepID=A0ABS5U417_9BACT|nr:tetratricopeptide repeat protein [Pelotalea chapellei]MBT1070410.1 tetratricopeptide repeat protein [Pelotalea chapellei]
MSNNKIIDILDSAVLHSAIIVVMVVLSYLNTLHVDFISVDDVSILDFLQTNEISLHSLFLGGGGDYFRPIPFLSFILDLQLFGRDPLAFHVMNAGLHLINALLVYLFALQTFKLSSLRKTAACVAALIFALHPVNSEAVLWMAGRTDLLCCTFFLLALLVGLNAQVDTIKATSAFFIMFLCSLLSKEASIATVLILPVYCQLNRSIISPERRYSLYGAMALAAGLYLAMRNGFHRGVDSGIGRIVGISAAKPFYHFVSESFAAFGFYIKKLLFPLPLNFAIVTINTNLYVVIGIIASITLLFLFWRIVSLRLSLLITVFGLAPPLLALHGKLPWTPFAERYLYLSSIGIALAVGICLSCCRSVRLRSLFFALVLTYACITISRVVLWTDSKAFWYDILQKSPEFPRSYVGVAIELIKEAKYDEAQRLLEKSLAMGYDTDFVWSNMAVICLARRDYAGYETAAVRAAQLSKQPTANYMALVYTITMNADKYADKVILYRRVAGYYLKAFERDPHYIDGLYNAAKSYLYVNENELAQKYFMQFLATPGETMYKPFAKRLLDSM